MFDLRAPALRGPHGGTLTFGCDEDRPDRKGTHHPKCLVAQWDARGDFLGYVVREAYDDPFMDRKVFEQWTDREGRQMGAWWWESEYPR